MPIDIDRFESESGFEPASNAERVLAFLARNDDKAFRRTEIAEGTGVDPDVVSSVLSRLEDRHLVKHKRPYWAIGDPERVRNASAFSQSLRALDERLGREDMDEWRSAAEAAEGESSGEGDDTSSPETGK